MNHKIPHYALGINVNGVGEIVVDANARWCKAEDVDGLTEQLEWIPVSEHEGQFPWFFLGQIDGREREVIKRPSQMTPEQYDAWVRLTVSWMLQVPALPSQEDKTDG